MGLIVALCKLYQRIYSVLFQLKIMLENECYREGAKARAIIYKSFFFLMIHNRPINSCKKWSETCPFPRTGWVVFKVSKNLKLFKKAHGSAVIKQSIFDLTSTSSVWSQINMFVIVFLSFVLYQFEFWHPKLCPNNRSQTHNY